MKKSEVASRVPALVFRVAQADGRCLANRAYLICGETTTPKQ